MGSSHGVPENHLEHSVIVQSGTLGIAAFEAWWGLLFGIKEQTRTMSLNSHSQLYLQLDLLILSSVNEPANHRWFLSSGDLVLISFLVSAREVGAGTRGRSLKQKPKRSVA